MKLIFASAKDKFITYDITDPYLKGFIYKYEKIIPWNNIKTSEDINNYIRNTLLPQLYSLIDEESENNYYLKDVDLDRQFERNMDQPNVQRAKSLRIKDEDLAKKEILDPINKNKKDAFHLWWNYMTEGNDAYREHPAFIYMVLKPIFDSSPADKVNGPLNQNALAISKVFEDMSSGEQVNAIKAYKKALLEVDEMSQTSNADTKKEGWVRIPSKRRDPENFSKNVNRLKNLSIPRGWCTGQNMAGTYLAKGDFWLLIRDGEARVAIRFDSDKIMEIQGHQNQRPFDYWEDIFQLIDEKGFDKESGHFKELEKAKILNERLENDPSYLEDFKEEIQKDPKLFDMLSKGNQERPELLSITVDYWQDLILSKFDKAFNNYESPLMIYGRIPEKVMPHINREVFEELFNYCCINLHENSVKQISNNSFFRNEDYAERLMREIEYQVRLKKLQLWRLAIISPNVRNYMKDEYKKALEGNDAYDLVIDLESVVTSSLNPEEIVDSYICDYDEKFYGKAQYELDELKNEDIENGEECDDTIYDQGLISYIGNETYAYWDLYISGDPIERWPELRDALSNSSDGRYEENHDLYSLEETYNDAWRERVRENPSCLGEAPDHILDDEWYGDEDEHWYLQAWIDYAEGNISETHEAKDYLPYAYGGSRLIESFYDRLFGISNYDQIKSEAKRNFGFLFDADNFDLIFKHSDFFKDNQDFVKRLIKNRINKKGLDKYLKDICDELNPISDYENLFTGEEEEWLDQEYRKYNLKLVSERPDQIRNIPSGLQNDSEFIEVSNSNIEGWVKALWTQGEALAESAPQIIKENDRFKTEVFKLSLVRRFRSDTSSLSEFYELIKPFSDDEDFVRMCRSGAKHLFSMLVLQSYKWLSDLNSIKESFGKIPDFLARDEKYMDDSAESLVRNIFYHSKGKVTGKELSQIDPRLVKFMLPKYEEFFPSINGINTFCKVCDIIREPYMMAPNILEKAYYRLKVICLSLLKNETRHFTYGTYDTKGHGISKEIIEKMPSLFNNDIDVQRGIQEATKAIQDLEERQKETQEFLSNYSNNWMKSYKYSNLPSNVKLIDHEGLLRVLASTPTERVTVGFRRRNNEFRVMNIQKESINDLVINAYDLQIASQLLNEPVNKVKISFVNKRLVQSSKKRISINSVEFIKIDGSKYLISGSKYLEELIK
jgi:hypothetical protein